MNMSITASPSQFQFYDHKAAPWQTEYTFPLAPLIPQDWWLRKSTSDLNGNCRSSYKFCLLHMQIRNVCPLISVLWILLISIDLYGKRQTRAHSGWPGSPVALQFLCKSKVTWHFAILRIGSTNLTACRKQVGEVVGVCSQHQEGWGRMAGATWKDWLREKKQNGIGELSSNDTAAVSSLEALYFS